MVLQPRKVQLKDLFSDEIEVFPARLSPAVCRELLAHHQYVNQRNVSEGNVQMLRHRLREGHWVISNDALVTSKPGANGDGKVLNAQHRLTAAVEENLPIDVLVMTGMDEDIFDSLDLGKTRSLSDYFTVQGIPNASQRSAASRVLFALEDLGLAELQNYHRKIHPSEILDKYNEHGHEAIDAALSVAGKVTRSLGLLSKTNIAGVHRFLEVNDKLASTEELIDFWTAAADQDRKGGKDAAVALRRAVEKENKEIIGRPRQKFAAALIAWAHWRDGRPLLLGDLLVKAQELEADAGFRRILIDYITDEDLWNGDDIAASLDSDAEEENAAA
jgi:hypothetical protein